MYAAADANIYAMLCCTALLLFTQYTTTRHLTGHLHVVQLLIELRADVDKGKSDDGTTATFIAAQDGQHGVVAMLAAAGADVNIPTDDGSTPLFMASG